MRVENLYIICVLNDLEEDTLYKSAKGLFFKYAGREGTLKVELWYFRRSSNAWTQESEWKKAEQYNGTLKIRSDEESETQNEGLKPAKNNAGGDAGAIIVAHGKIGSLAGTPAPDVAKKIGAQAKSEGWPVFRKIVLEVCRSATANPKDQRQDPTVAQQFLKAYATEVGTYDSVMIVGYDAAVSVAYDGKSEMPDDAYDEKGDVLPEFYGRKFLMQYDTRNNNAAWMSNVKGNENKFTNNTKNAKVAYSYKAVQKNDKKTIAVEIALDGWSDRE